MNRYIKDRYLITKFDSPIEMVEQVEKTPLTGKANFWRIDPDWVGRHFNSWQEVIEASRGPWQEGVAEIEKYRAKIDSEIELPKSIKRKRKFTDNGATPDIDRYLSHDPMFLSEIVRSKQSGNKSISLVCNTGNNCDVSSNIMYIRSAAAIALADLLEEAGYSCEIIGYLRSRNTYHASNYKNLLSITTIKQAGDPLEINNIAVALSPWFFRTIQVESIFQANPREADPGLGYSSHGVTDLEEHFDLTGSTPYYFPMVVSTDHAVEAAKELIEQLNTAS